MEENAFERSADARIRKAMMTLLKDRPLKRVTVSAICETADVNRSTFYRHYENVDDLFEVICDDLVDAMTYPPEKPIENAADLEAHARAITEKSKDRFGVIGLLSSPNGDVQFAYRVGMAMRDHLATLWEATGLDDPAVDRCIGTIPAIFPAVISYVSDDALTQEDDRVVVEFDDSQSFLDNVAAYLAKARGGSQTLQYVILLSAVKLTLTMTAAEITVTRLFRTAGISRTEFYRYYRNIEDYENAVEQAVIVVASSWVSAILLGRKELSPEAMSQFVDTEMTRKGIVRYFTSGAVAASYPRLYAAVVNRLELPDDLEHSVGILSAVSYYITLIALEISKYTLGMCDFESLDHTIQMVRGKLRGFRTQG